MAFFETVLDAFLNLEVNGVSLDGLLGVALIVVAAGVGYAYFSKKLAKPVSQ
mgnify:CR=1 FL=1